MEAQEHKSEDLASHLKAYIKVQSELMELQLIEKASVSGSEIISRLVIGTGLLIFLIFLSLGFSVYLSQVLHDNMQAFLWIAAFYLFLVILLFVFRRQWLTSPVRNKIIRGLTKER